MLLAPEGGSSQTHLLVNLDLKYDRLIFAALSTITTYSVQVSPSAGAVDLRFNLLLFFGTYPSSVFLSLRLFCDVRMHE